jgi:hypothetical protein
MKGCDLATKRKRFSSARALRTVDSEQVYPIACGPASARLLSLLTIDSHHIVLPTSPKQQREMVSERACNPNQLARTSKRAYSSGQLRTIFKKTTAPEDILISSRQFLAMLSSNRLPANGWFSTADTGNIQPYCNLERSVSILWAQDTVRNSGHCHGIAREETVYVT